MYAALIYETQDEAPDIYETPDLADDTSTLQVNLPSSKPHPQN